MQTYTTVSGDAWDIIAKKVYNNELLADRLMMANFHLLDTFIFSANVTVNVPELEEKTSNSLPDWRK